MNVIICPHCRYRLKWSKGSPYCDNCGENLTRTPLKELVQTRSIRRNYHGGMDDVTFAEFAEFIVQDYDVALGIVAQMLAMSTPYSWNEDEPMLFETFSIIDEHALRAQVQEQLFES